MLTYAYANVRVFSMTVGTRPKQRACSKAFVLLEAIRVLFCRMVCDLCVQGSNKVVQS